MLIFCSMSIFSKDWWGEMGDSQELSPLGFQPPLPSPKPHLSLATPILLPTSFQLPLLHPSVLGTTDVNSLGLRAF